MAEVGGVLRYGPDGRLSFNDGPGDDMMAVRPDGTIQVFGDLLDAAGDPIGTSLTGWETDGSGNLVCTGGGAIVSDALTAPIIVKSTFQANGPIDASEGTFFRIVSDNLDYSSETPSNKSMLEFDEFANDIRIMNRADLRLGTGSKIVQVASQSGGGDYVQTIVVADISTDWNYANLAWGNQGIVQDDGFVTLSIAKADHALAQVLEADISQTVLTAAGRDSAYARIEASDHILLSTGLGTPAERWRVDIAGKLIPTIAHEVTGARDEPEGALASVLTILKNLGIITDSTTAS